MAKDYKDAKTVWVTLDTQLYYAQVFEENRDKGEMHSETDGVTKVTLRLTDEQIQDMKDKGVPESALGYQTFKDMTIGDETFRTYTAKRPWVSKYLKNEDGSKVEMGAPLVFDYNKAAETFKEAGGNGFIKDEHITPWLMKDGLLGNGTKAKVKLSIYRGKNKAGKPTCVVTLEKIAITDHVPYEGGTVQDPDNISF